VADVIIGIPMFKNIFHFQCNVIGVTAVGLLIWKAVFLLNAFLLFIEIRLSDDQK